MSCTAEVSFVENKRTYELRELWNSASFQKREADEISNFTGAIQGGVAEVSPCWPSKQKVA